MDVLRLRILTRKSTHKFGFEENKDLPVQMLIDLNKHHVMISAYFALGRITYMDDILDELGITEDMRISKPGKLPTEEIRPAVSQALSNIYSEKTEDELMHASVKAKARARKRRRRTLGSISRSNKRGKLQSKNHGHGNR